MNTSRRIIIFLVFVIGCIFLLSLIFGSGNKSNSSTKNVKKSFSLLDYKDKDSKVIAIIDGKINGDDEHRAVRISINRYSRTMDVIQGYEGNVIKTKTYTNNQNAYEDFLYALSRTGYGKVRKNSKLNSEKGVCPLGRRYVFEVLDNNDSVSRTWTSSCNTGNSLAKPDSVMTLFKNQITDYSKLTIGTSL